MCGIFGWHLPEGQLSNTRRKQLYDLLALQNDTRGGHSWGVCAIDNTSKTPVVERGLGKMFPARYKDILPWKQNIMFGHTRFKTHGEAVVENAHPFEIGDVIGAHNGVLSNHFELNRQFNRSFRVDSQHIFAHIDEGHKFKSLEGYGAIEYVFKTNPSIVYLGTFSHHLSIWRILDNKKSVGIVWTSDDKHGKFAMQMARVEFEELKVEDRTVYVVQDADSFRTKLRMNVKSPATKWDWRRGEVGAYSSSPSTGYQPTVSHFRGHDHHTTTTYKPHEQKFLPVETEGSSGHVENTLPTTTESEDAKSSRRGCPSNVGNLPVANNWRFCDFCYEPVEDCCCDRGMSDRDENFYKVCPDCEEGFVEMRLTDGRYDYSKCKNCNGSGWVEAVDSAFGVKDGYNDRIPSC